MFCNRLLVILVVKVCWVVLLKCLVIRVVRVVFWVCLVVLCWDFWVVRRIEWLDLFYYQYCVFGFSHVQVIVDGGFCFFGGLDVVVDFYLVLQCIDWFDGGYDVIDQVCVFVIEQWVGVDDWVLCQIVLFCVDCGDVGDCKDQELWYCVYGD